MACGTPNTAVTLAAPVFRIAINDVISAILAPVSVTTGVEITIDDAKTYNKPFTFKVTHLLQADSDILEYICNENEKDRAHMVR